MRLLNEFTEKKLLYRVLGDWWRLTEDFLSKASRKGYELYATVEVPLKGSKIRLPEGKSFTDKDGIVRRQVRNKWWALENGRDNLHTWGDISQIEDEEIARLPLTPVVKNNLPRYGNGNDPKPVFFGHYWFDGKSDPRILSWNTGCDG